MKVAWDQALQWEKKAAGQIGKYRRAKRAEPCLSARFARPFFSPLLANAEPGPVLRLKIKALGKIEMKMA